jgi:hypothetical protein
MTPTGCQVCADLRGADWPRPDEYALSARYRSIGWTRAPASASPLVSWSAITAVDRGRAMVTDLAVLAWRPDRGVTASDEGATARPTDGQ